MAQFAKARLFTISLLLLLVAGLTAERLSAAVFAQVDVQLDLEEIELRHQTELRLASRMHIESFRHTQCDFFDRARFLGLRNEAKGALERELSLGPIEITESTDEQADVPPAPRAESIEKELTESAEEILGPISPNAEAVPAQATWLASELMPESTLCEIEVEQDDAVAHHLDVINQRRAWQVMSGFISARRAEFGQSVQSTASAAQKIYLWANERFQAAQIHVQPRVELEPISTREIPMFLIAIVEEADNATSETDDAEVTEADVNSVSEDAESADATVPADLFHNEKVSPISIDLERSDRDPYWQYYDDCDRWGVNFAKLVNEAQSYQSTAAVLDQTLPNSTKSGSTTVANRPRPTSR